MADRLLDILSIEVGAPALIPLVVFPGGIASGESLGAPTVAISGALTVYPNGIVSAEALGTPLITYVIFPGGVGSGEALGLPLIGINVVVYPAGITSLAAVGIPVVAGPVWVDGIGTREAVGSPLVLNAGLLRVVSGGVGAIDGGSQVTLTGAILDMKSCMPSFDASGSWVRGGLVRGGRLSAVNPLGGVASLTSVELVDDVDVTATFVVGSLVGRGVVAASLALGGLSVFVEGTLVSGAPGRVRVVASGIDVGVGSAVPSGRYVLRLVRLGSSVVVYVNGLRMTAFTWNADAVPVVLSCANRSGTSVVTSVVGYVRHAVVGIGGVPCEVYTDVSRTHVTARLTVAAPFLPGPRDVTVRGCSSTETILDAVTYELGDRGPVGRSSTSTLIGV